jgi:hypothetical protein
LNIICKATKLLENTREVNIDGIVFGEDFLDATPQAQPIKEENHELGFMKSALYYVKDRVNNMKRPIILGEIILQNIYKIMN